jgi:putative mRNA 3-end processing factor
VDAGDLVVLRPEGLYCPQGEFYIDPWRPVEHALITHAHADHARTGHAHYLAASPGHAVLKSRLGDINLQSLPYGEALRIRDVEVTFFPAGHVLGSAQIRIVHRGCAWVVSGDYKLEPDITCDPFEPVRCHTFITESTFGLPIYHWRPHAQLYADINTWWQRNADAGRSSVLYAYSFGKAQRILAGLDTRIGPVVVHSAVETLNKAYRAQGVELPDAHTISTLEAGVDLRRAFVLAPPAAQGSAYLKRFGDYADAFASGWMQLRGARRRRGVDQGFVLSDHADWNGLLNAIAASGAERVIVTHGSVSTLVRYLQEQGMRAEAFSTQYGAEEAA